MMGRGVSSVENVDKYTYVVVYREETLRSTVDGGRGRQ